MDTPLGPIRLSPSFGDALHEHPGKMPAYLGSDFRATAGISASCASVKREEHGLLLNGKKSFPECISSHAAKRI